jgi:hypothetical protein
VKVGNKIKTESCDFSKEYKTLPVKKRVRLIKIAKTLLKQQQENKTLLADAIASLNECKNKIIS